MQRLFLALAAGVLGLALTGAAQAHPVSRVRTVTTRHVETRNVYREGGRGRHGHIAHHWGRRVWSPVYHRYHYWDEGLHCYFYYDSGCGDYVQCP